MEIGDFKVICSLFCFKPFYPNTVYRYNSTICIQKFITAI